MAKDSSVVATVAEAALTADDASHVIPTDSTATGPISRGTSSVGDDEDDEENSPLATPLDLSVFGFPEEKGEGENLDEETTSNSAESDSRVMTATTTEAMGVDDGPSKDEEVDFQELVAESKTEGR